MKKEINAELIHSEWASNLKCACCKLIPKLNSLVLCRSDTNRTSPSGFHQSHFRKELLLNFHFIHFMFLL